MSANVVGFIARIFQESALVIRLGFAAALFLTLEPAKLASGCPFCLAIEPTLAQRREAAAAVALGEAAGEAANGKSSEFQLHSVFKGRNEVKQRSAVDAGSVAAKPGTLAILFGASGTAANDRQLEWNAVFANETLLGYFSQAPDLREPPEKRLAYFARYLEHPDRDIARDAYLEFAHAPYDDVRTIADKFDYASMRKWLLSKAVPDERKGFYGLTLGMAKATADRDANRAVLQQLIKEDRDDFRSGLDGVMAGYLLISGSEALKVIESRYLANEKAPHGDIRHAARALRFYFEYGPKALRSDIASTVTRLVERPAFAAAAITDLARWEHWDVLETVMSLFHRQGFDDAPTQRAIVGFLKACPDRRAAACLERLRVRDPKRIESLENSLLLPAK
jgi:hypothetical protein